MGVAPPGTATQGLEQRSLFSRPGCSNTAPLQLQEGEETPCVCSFALPLSAFFVLPHGQALVVVRLRYRHNSLVRL